MIVSREEAEMILGKLDEEGNIVGLVSHVGGVVVAMNGFVGLAEGCLIVEHGTTLLEKAGARHECGAGRITIKLDSIAAFDYSDVREATQEIRDQGAIRSALRLESPAITCVIFERLM